MGKFETRPREPDDGLFPQFYCPSCGTAYYEDEADYSNLGEPLCKSCHTSLTVVEKRPRRLFYQYRMPIVRLTVLEFLLVAVTVGAIAYYTAPALLEAKGATERLFLQVIYLQNASQEMSRLTFDILDSQDVSLDNIVGEAANQVGVPPQDFSRFEADLKQFQGMDSRVDQLRSIRKTLEEWQSRAAPTMTEGLPAP